MRDADVADEPITELLPRLRAEHDGISAENLAFAARRHMPDGTLSTSLISKIETGKRHPTVAVMEAIAAALDVDPALFVEWRLAKTRALFDERERPLSEALGNLQRVAPDPAVEEAEAVREFVAAYDELRESGAAPPARAGRARSARRRRAAS